MVIMLRRQDSGTVTLIVSMGGVPSRFVPLGDEDQFLLADVLRHVDRIAFGESPGPCERWLARQDESGAAA